MTTATKYFSQFEAQKTLPLVKQIVKDILDTSKEVRLLAEEIEGDFRENPEVKKMVDNINHFMQELEEIGCYYKDWNFTIGLVDFPAVINGEEVFLCWRSDEDDIKYYHEIEEGYTNRKPIPSKYFNN